MEAKMLTENVPRGNLSLNAGLVLIVERAKRRIAPGGARRMGNVAACRQCLGAKKYNIKAIRYDKKADRMVNASNQGVDEIRDFGVFFSGSEDGLSEALLSGIEPLCFFWSMEGR